jgi:hypothetical protein
MPSQNFISTTLRSSSNFFTFLDRRSQFKSEKELDRDLLVKILNDLHETIQAEEGETLKDLVGSVVT